MTLSVTTDNKTRIYQIVRPTQCTSRDHVWIWASSYTNTECPPELLCDCGGFRRDEIDIATKDCQQVTK